MLKKCRECGTEIYPEDVFFVCDRCGAVYCEFCGFDGKGCIVCENGYLRKVYPKRDF